MLQLHHLGDPGSVKLGIRLVAGVRRAGTAALVEHDFPADAPPAFAQIAVGSELGRRRKRARPHTSEPGPGNQRQRLVEAVFEEIVVRELAFEALRHDPVAVVYGEPHAQFDDAEDIVMIQPIDGKDLVHKFTVAGDDAGPQPVEQAFVGQLEPQRKQPAMTLLFFKQCAGKTVQPLRPQVEGEQSRIILFQDEFHCLHRIFSDPRIFPKGEHDTQTHNNILLQTVKFNRKYGDFQQCHLQINEIRHNSHPRHYPDTADRDGNGLPISG